VRTELSRTYRIEAAHRLPHVPAGHKCARLHGHSFHLTLHVGGQVDPTLGWILDYADIDKAFEPLFAQLDHHYLNEVPGLENPTSELLARFVLERVQLPAGKLLAVSVAETCMSSCKVFADEEFTGSRGGGE
jgi:6-pyruvoyltetrahydropterin/6-carboxytetrahydropterin synthase